MAQMALFRQVCTQVEENRRRLHAVMAEAYAEGARSGPYGVKGQRMRPEGGVPEKEVLRCDRSGLEEAHPLVGYSAETSCRNGGPKVVKCTLNVTMAAVFALLIPVVTLAQESFYEGKTVRLIAGGPPGGGYDAYARIFARHMGRYIPGNPNIIVQNMPGGGGLFAHNYLYNVARPDGLTFAQATWTIAQAEFLGFPGVEYDVTKFAWLGLATASIVTGAIRSDAPIQTIDQWLDPKTPPLIWGCTGKSSLTCSLPQALNDVFGPISKIVRGYGGTAPVRQAMLQKEVDGLTGWGWDSVKATGMPMIEAGEIKLLFYIAAEPYAELEERKVPNLMKRVKNANDLSFLEVLLAPATMNRPLAAPPGTPADKVTILRSAFDKTVKDPEFLGDAKRLKIQIDPRNGEWLAEFIGNMKKQITPEIKARAEQVLGIGG